MQNIDFSAHMRRTPGRPEPKQATAVPVPAHELRTRNRAYVWILVLLIFAFTAGLVAGLQIGRLRHIEANLVSRPDEERFGNSDESTESAPTSNTESTSFANTGGDPDEGRFLIKAGTFAPNAAELLARRLNNLPELAQIKPVKCKNIRESEPGRYLAFRVRLNDGSDRQNVFLGCFLSQGRAREALEAATASGLPGLSGARLYEIE